MVRSEKRQQILSECVTMLHAAGPFNCDQVVNRQLDAKLMPVEAQMGEEWHVHNVQSLLQTAAQKNGYINQSFEHQAPHRTFPDPLDNRSRGRSGWHGVCAAVNGYHLCQSVSKENSCLDLEEVCGLYGFMSLNGRDSVAKYRTSATLSLVSSRTPTPERLRDWKSSSVTLSFGTWKTAIFQMVAET